ncbi:MAG: DUF2877 domain-containing protein [Anaerolineae bacterium]|nr:DUF2877 domain-containing protein [Anaerolineae bacterium]
MIGFFEEMRLKAVSAGNTVPVDAFTGHVHSVFRRVCNVRLEDNTLVTLLAHEFGDLPQGIRIQAPGDFTFKESHLYAGQIVVCHAGIVQFAGSPLKVDLQKLQLWDAGIKALTVDITNSRTLQAWEIAWDTLLAFRTPDGLAMLAGPSAVQAIDLLKSSETWPLIHRAYPVVRSLVLHSQLFELDGANRAIGSLIGLGPGLTPSGDDFLVGFMAGLWSTSGTDRQRRAYISGFGTRLSTHMQHTTDVSRSYLRHAAAGRVSATLIALLQALQSGDDAERIRQITRQALAVGSSSGADTVLGLLTGLKTWQ